MAKYSFRMRFLRSPTNTINISSPRWEWPTSEDTPPIILSSQDGKVNIENSKILVLKSEGWFSEEDARQAASTYVPTFLLTLAKLRVGVDIGNYAPKSAFTSIGLALLEKQNGFRVLNDVHGLMFYESKPTPRFIKSDASVLLGVKQENFEFIFSKALEKVRQLTEKEMLAFDLYNASFFQHSKESRFLMLIMAIEALIDSPLKSPESVAHVEFIIKATKESESLPSKEKQSFIGSLERLKYESISQSGQKLVTKKLSTKRYMDKEAASFFSHCYNIRSKLVHGGDTNRIQNKIAITVAQLEVFVSDLLSGNLRNIQLL